MTSGIRSKTWDIVAGPSREELFDALRLRHKKMKVEFSITQRDSDSDEIIVKAKVDAISVEDGSGDCWEFRLYEYSEKLGAKHLKGFINTRTRTGYIEHAHVK